MKRDSKPTRRDRHSPVALPTEALIAPGPRARGIGELKPKNDAQRRCIATINASQLTFLKGPAGTGKTHCAAGLAALALRDKVVDQVIVTRPNVEAGTPMGFLKGTMEEKFAPYFLPVRKIFEKILGAATVEAYIANGRIEIAPVPFLQGHTFENAFVLLDEAQNMTPREMEMFLTRIGEHSKIVVDGDAHQRFGEYQGIDGFTDAIDRMRGVKSVSVFEFTLDDIVRSGLVREVIERYRNNSRKPHDNDDHIGSGAAPYFLGIPCQ
jgi:phosphate starvation-inducible PhoH-like protein